MPLAYISSLSIVSMTFTFGLLVMSEMSYMYHSYFFALLPSKSFNSSVMYSSTDIFCLQIDPVSLVRFSTGLLI
jgi:hypothetical protein